MHRKKAAATTDGRSYINQFNKCFIFLASAVWRSGCQIALITYIERYTSTPLNGYNVRFNGALRIEVLNVEWFLTTRQVQTAINVWLRQSNYNEELFF